MSPAGYGRRSILRAAILGGAGAALPGCLHSATRPPPLPSPPASTPWPEADAILAGTALPRIPEATCAAGAFGARGNGIADDTAALQDALDATAAGGGGRVVVEPGAFRAGALRLRSRVELHLMRGATLEFCMIHWTVGETNFYSTFKRRRSDEIARRELIAEGFITE